VQSEAQPPERQQELQCDDNTSFVAGFKEMTEDVGGNQWRGDISRFIHPQLVS